MVVSVLGTIIRSLHILTIISNQILAPQIKKIKKKKKVGRGYTKCYKKIPKDFKLSSA